MPRGAGFQHTGGRGPPWKEAASEQAGLDLERSRVSNQNHAAV